MFLTPDIVQLESSPHAHIFLIKQLNGWSMIDAGLPGQFKKITQELSAYQISWNDIKQILLTHGDVDHVGNLKQINEHTNCCVYAHGNEIPYLLKQKHYSKRKRFFKFLLRIPRFTCIQSFPQNLGEIKVIESFGHTPGHVCFRYNEYLFIGDLINSRNGTINLMSDKFTFAKTQSLNSIKNLPLDGIKYLCPAHGDIIKIDDFKVFINAL